MFTVARRHQWLLGCAASCLVALAGCGGGNPEKVFRSWSSAVQANNFPAIWECLTPQTRGTVLQIMVLDSDLLSAANPAAKQAFGTVFAKYGLNPQETGFAQSRLQVTEAADYALELNNVLRQYQSDLSKLEGSRYQKLNAIWGASALIVLGPIQQQGTRATAAVQGSIPHTAANAQVQAVFEKVNGQWLFAELEENSGTGAMAGGPAAARTTPPGTMPAGPAGQGAMPPRAGAAGGAMPSGDTKAMPGNLPAAPGQPLGTPEGAGAGDRLAPLPSDPKSMPAAAGAGALPAGPSNMREGGLPLPEGKAMPARPGGPGELGAEGAKAMPANPGGGTPAGPMAGKAAGGDGKAMPPMPARPGALGPEGLMPGRDGLGDPKNMPANAAGGGDPAGPNAAEAGGPGRPGRDGGAAGGSQNQTRPKEGTWEYAVVIFMEKMAEGDYSGMEYVVTSKAKGLLKEIRNDEVSAEKKNELKAAFAGFSPVEGSAKNTGAAITLSVKGKLGHVIQLSVGKENGEFRIRELKINEPGATKKR